MYTAIKRTALAVSLVAFGASNAKAGELISLTAEGSSTLSLVKLLTRLQRALDVDVSVEIMSNPRNQKKLLEVLKHKKAQDISLTILGRSVLVDESIVRDCLERPAAHAAEIDVDIDDSSLLEGRESPDLEVDQSDAIDESNHDELLLPVEISNGAYADGLEIGY